VALLRIRRTHSAPIAPAPFVKRLGPDTSRAGRSSSCRPAASLSDFAFKEFWLSYPLKVPLHIDSSHRVRARNCQACWAELCCGLQIAGRATMCFDTDESLQRSDFSATCHVEKNASRSFQIHLGIAVGELLPPTSESELVKVSDENVMVNES
jgi:hypothetical protein